MARSSKKTRTDSEDIFGNLSGVTSTTPAGDMTLPSTIATPTGTFTLPEEQNVALAILQQHLTDLRKRPPGDWVGVLTSLMALYQLQLERVKTLMESTPDDPRVDRGIALAYRMLQEIGKRT